MPKAPKRKTGFLLDPLDATIYVRKKYPKLDGAWAQKVGEWVQGIAREEKLLPGCTRALPVGVKEITVDDGWPLEGKVRVELEDGRVYSYQVKVRWRGSMVQSSKWITKRER